MHDARPVDLAVPELGQAGELGIHRQQAGDERARPVGAIGMNHDAGWLVDDDHRLVVKDDPKRDLSRLSRRRHGTVSTDDEAQVGLEDLTDSDPPAAGGDDHAAEANPSGRDELRNLGPCPAGQQSHDPIHPLAPERAGDLDHRSQVAFLDHAASCRPGSGGCLVAEDRQRTMQRRMLPQTIDESATLNVGQKPE